MLLLKDTASFIRVTCSTTGADLRVHASWIDEDSPSYNPGSQNTPAIVNTTPTIVVPSPSGTAARNVKHLNITNNHATVGTPVLVEHSDGTTVIPLMGVTLLPGENLVFGATGEWRHHDAQGAEYTYNVPPSLNLGPAGCIAETIPRDLCSETNTTVAASGTLWMQAIKLVAGQVLNNIMLSSATTAAGTPTNCIAGIYNAARQLVAQTADQLTAAWAANTVKTLALTAAYRVPTSGLYYIGYYMKATTVITMKGGTARATTGLANIAPILAGTSTTALTTALPATAGSITVSLASIYAAVT